MQEFNTLKIFCRSRPLLFVTTALVGVLISGCGQQVKPETPKGNSSYKVIVPDSAEKYALQQGQSYTGSNLEKRVDPAYPSELVSANLKPLDIVGQVIIDETGHVSDVRFANYLGDNTNRVKFEKPIKEAVLQWKYSPLSFTTTQIDSSGKSVVTTQAKPFSLWYMFHFEIRNGKPVSGVEQSNNSLGNN